MDQTSLEESGILPKLHVFYNYEIYDMKSYIGFKVGPRCFKLSNDKHFKLLKKHELPNEKSGSVLIAGHILFQKALETLNECSDNVDISAAHLLVSKFNSIPKYFYILLHFLWNLINIDNFCTVPTKLTENFMNFFKSSAMIKSKKMPKEKNFLDVYQKNYKTLCRYGVIPNPALKKENHIAFFIKEERRHAGIIIRRSEHHSFVLELSCRLYQYGVYNCPVIRYIPDDEIVCENYVKFNRSADHLKKVASDTVAKMENYDILRNNCQNFVRNFLCTLNPSIEIGNTEGEKALFLIRFLTSNLIFRLLYPISPYLIVLFCILKNYILPSALCPLFDIILMHIFIFLLILSIYPIECEYSHAWMLIVIYFFFSQNVVIFHALCLNLVLFAIRVLGLRPSYIVVTFSLLAITVGFIANNLFLVSVQFAVAMAVYTILFGIWSAIGKTYKDLAIILPCCILLISILNSSISWIYTEVLLMFLVYLNLTFKSNYKNVTLLLTPIIIEFSMNSLEEQMIETYIVSQLIILIFYGFAKNEGISIFNKDHDTRIRFSADKRKKNKKNKSNI